MLRSKRVATQNPTAQRYYVYLKSGRIDAIEPADRIVVDRLDVQLLSDQDVTATYRRSEVFFCSRDPASAVPPV